MRTPTSEVGAFGLLAVLATLRALVGFDPGGSVDFYQFWAVSTARELHAGLPPPYVDPEATRAVLEEAFQTERDPRVLRVHRFRMGEFEPYGSPLLYLVFAPLPRDYRTALRGFACFQALCFALGAAGLLRMAGARTWTSVGVAALLLVAYRPFGDDLFTGNLGSVELAGLVAAIGLGEVACRMQGIRRRLALGAVLAGLAALVLVKANAAPPAVALVLHLLWRVGGRDFGRASVAALLPLVPLLAAPCLYFRSASVWLDWARLVFTDPDRLADYALAVGNTATPRLLDEWWGVDPVLASAALALVLAVSLAPFARRAFDAAPRAAGLGVVAVFALAPLVWFHYFVLALVPGLWLLAPSRPTTARVWGGVALVLYSAVYVPVVVAVAPAAVTSVLQPLWALAWIPLWIGLLRSVSRASPPG